MEIFQPFREIRRNFGCLVWLLSSILLSPFAANSQCISRSANARCDTIIPSITCVSGSPICYESVATLHLSSHILVDTVCVSFGDGQDTTFAAPDTTFDITHYYHFTPDDSCPPWNGGEPGINCDIRANFFKRCPLGYSFNYSQTSVSFRFKPRADLNLQHAEYCTTDSALILDYGCTNSYLQTDSTDYWWDYGDGTHSDTVWNTDFSYFNSFPHLYSTPGTYIVGLFAQNQCGIDSDRVTVDTYTMTDIQFSSPVPVCNTDTIHAHITGIGNSNYYLTSVVPPNASVHIFNSSSPDPLIVFDTAGSYLISFHFGTCIRDTLITVSARVNMVQDTIPDLCDNNGSNPLVFSDYYHSTPVAGQVNYFWVRNSSGVIYTDTTSAFLSASINLPDTGWYVITDTSVTICNTKYYRDSFNVVPRFVINLPPDETVCLQTVYVLPTFPATTITLAGDNILITNDTIHIDSARIYRFVYRPNCGNSDTLTITGQGISVEAYDSFYCARPGNIALTGSRPNMVFSGQYVSSALGIMYGDSSNAVLNTFYAAYTDPATGCVFQDSAVITIAPPLNPQYSVTDTACINSTVQFIYNDSLKYVINWGDGTIDSLTTHSYSSAGTKYVSVTFSDSVCSEVHRDTVVVVAEPVAFFSLAPDTICYSDSSFISFTPDPQYTSSWNYGGLTTTTLPLIVDTSSVNQFLTVPITLSVSSAFCPVVQYTDYIYFNRAVLPVIALNYDSTCSPLAITIINNSALYPAADFSWYKNGVLFSNSSTLQQFDTLYADQSDSAYTFKLVVFSCNRYDSVSQTVVVHQGNFVPVLYTDTSQNCVFVSFRFSASIISNCIVTYDFGDGTFSQPVPSDSAVTHAYDAAGDYTVNLTMYCQCKIKSDNLMVHVNPGPVISLSVPPLGCADSTITITSQNNGGISSGGYTTFFGDGNYDSISANPAHVYSSPGVYNGWVVTHGINGCRSDSAFFNVTVYQTPSAHLPSVDTGSCSSVLINLSVDTVFSNSTYNWSIDYNNQTIPVTTFNGALQFYAPDTGVHYIFLNVYSNSNNSCVAYSDTIKVTIYPSPVISVSAPSAGCTDSTLVITSQNTGTVITGVYHTYFGDGTYDLFSANPIHTYNVPGTFYGWMVAQGVNGCPSDTANFDVIIYQTPSVNMPPIDTAACASVLTLFAVDSVLPHSTYEWGILYNNQITRATSYDGTLPFFATEPGVHLVFLTAYNDNHNSCVAYSDTFKVTIYPVPTALFSVDAPLIYNSEFSFPLHNMSVPTGNTYIWNFGDSTFSNEINPLPHGYSKPGSYLIMLTARNGPCEDTTSHLVVVNPYLQLFVPNVFTPNNDGNNDYFEMFGNRNDIDYLHVQIFDRIGEKVFDSFDINFKWDGTYKGIKLQPAVYVYTIEVSGINDPDNRLMKGSITLLR